MQSIIRLSLFIAALVLPLGAAHAQSKPLPSVPPAIQDLVDRGAQLKYLGKRHGMDGWITIYQGQEQYYYVTPDKEGFVMGVLFDKGGEMATVDQVRKLQAEGGDVLDFLAVDKEPEAKSLESVKEATAFKSPAEKMLADVESSNWIALGNKNAPVIYSFVDPQCPHCHDFMADLRKNFIDKGLVQVRIIPVGFTDQTLAQAAFLLAAPDAEARWFKHLDGDKAALPIETDINTQGIQKNLALMQAWKFSVTPLSVYRGKDGEIKIVRGRSKDPAGLVADLPAQ
jgi:thiol:disulfide interchange protein DsbG